MSTSPSPRRREDEQRAPAEQAPQTAQGEPYEQRSPEGPRLVEEHRFVDPSGEGDLEATDSYGRRWYSLRPQPRGSYDVAGFSFLWWTIFWVLVIGLIVWGWGWGWAT